MKPDVYEANGLTWHGMYGTYHTSIAWMELMVSYKGVYHVTCCGVKAKRTFTAFPDACEYAIVFAKYLLAKANRAMLESVKL